MPSPDPSTLASSLAIEYGHLKNHAPTGVHLLPTEDPLKFVGAIFIRRGSYQVSFESRARVCVGIDAAVARAEDDICARWRLSFSYI